MAGRSDRLLTLSSMAGTREKVVVRAALLAASHGSTRGVTKRQVKRQLPTRVDVDQVGDVLDALVSDGDATLALTKYKLTGQGLQAARSHPAPHL